MGRGGEGWGGGGAGWEGRAANGLTQVGIPIFRVCMHAEPTMVRHAALCSLSTAFSPAARWRRNAPESTWLVRTTDAPVTPVFHTMCSIPCVSYHVFKPCVHTMCSHHEFKPCVQTMCSHHVFKPCVQTMCSHHVFTPFVQTMCSNHVFKPCVHTMCSHFLLPHVFTSYVPSHVFSCIHTMYSHHVSRTTCCIVFTPHLVFTPGPLRDIAIDGDGCEHVNAERL